MEMKMQWPEGADLGPAMIVLVAPWHSGWRSKSVTPPSAPHGPSFATIASGIPKIEEPFFRKGDQPRANESISPHPFGRLDWWH